MILVFFFHSTSLMLLRLHFGFEQLCDMAILSYVMYPKVRQRRCEGYL